MAFTLPHGRFRTLSSSNFGLASGNGLSAAAILTILALIGGGSAIGVWADRLWPAVSITVPAENVRAKAR